MSAPAVSVLMTAYNRERYIAAAIESVLAQTFADFELIVVDDASSDGTVAAARAYEADPRVRVVVNDENLGDYPNRNRAARLARGRYLKYHDSDDVMYPHCLATMLPLLEAAPGAGYALSGASGWAGGPCPMLLTPRMCYQREFLGTQGLFMCGPASALFRADVFRRLGGFPEVGPASDYLFWLTASAVVSVLLVPGDLFWYRIHPAQELRRQGAARQYAEAWGRCWRMVAAPGCPLTEEEREQAKRNWAFNMAKMMWRELRQGRLRAAGFQLRHAGLTPADWLRYLRRPRRHRLAGTPADQGGQYVIPDWTRPRRPPVASSRPGA